MRIVLLVATALALMGSQAQAAKLVAPHVPARFERALERAKVPMPRGRIELRYGLCPGTRYEDQVQGCVFDPGGDPVIYLWDTTVMTLMHELGHVFDAQLMREHRKEFRRLTGDRGPWTGEWTGSGWTSGEIPVQEVFAEEYVECAAGNYDATMPGVCRLIRRAGD